VTDDALLAEQLTYYRRRAGEYDRTAFGDVEAAGERIAAIVADLRPTGNVLELACGTGMWTRALLWWADTLTAVDGAPEMLAEARARVSDRQVT
jgi:demethylmenaquinone methyltransferase/2-methoxy-6-polyprenyl-1,4-benzoquinol methylase